MMIVSQERPVVLQDRLTVLQVAVSLTRFWQDHPAVLPVTAPVVCFVNIITVQSMKATLDLVLALVNKSQKKNY